MVSELGREEPGTEPKIEFGNAAPDHHLILLKIIGETVLVVIVIFYALSFHNGFIPFAIVIGFVLAGDLFFSYTRNFQKVKLLHDRGIEIPAVSRDFLAGEGKGTAGENHEITVTILLFYVRYEFFVSSTKYLIKQEINKRRYIKFPPGAAVGVLYVPEDPRISRLVSWPE